MKLQEFLEKVGREEREIINYKGQEALEAVQRSGYNLSLVKPEDQTKEICLASIKRNVDAFMYINPNLLTQKMCLHILKYDGTLLRFIHNQNPKICIAAVRRNKEAIMYVNKNIFEK